jgi:hypothetical protein
VPVDAGFDSYIPEHRHIHPGSGSEGKHECSLRDDCDNSETLRAEGAADQNVDGEGRDPCDDYAEEIL